MHIILTGLNVIILSMSSELLHWHRSDHLNAQVSVKLPFAMLYATLCKPQIQLK